MGTFQSHGRVWHRGKADDLAWLWFSILGVKSHSFLGPTVFPCTWPSCILSGWEPLVPPSPCSCHPRHKKSQECKPPPLKACPLSFRLAE